MRVLLLEVPLNVDPSYAFTTFGVKEGLPSTQTRQDTSLSSPAVKVTLSEEALRMMAQSNPEGAEARTVIETSLGESPELQSGG